jgi:hypothetical protein
MGKPGLPVDYSDPEVKQALKEMGARGGRSRSDAKREAARANQKKAVEARKQARLGRLQ